MFLKFLEMFNYCLVLIYGLFLSVFIAGGWKKPTQKRLVFILCPVFLALQGLCSLLWGVDTARQIYPLIVHLPLVLILIFALKKKTDVALVSVCTAYLCCQLPRWVNLLITSLSGSPLAGEVGYTLSIFPIYFLLHRYFVRVAHNAMTYSTQSLYLFGSLPFAYYLFDYATVIYSDALYAGIPALTEFFPTIFVLFYVAFLTAYHTQTQKRNQVELQRSMLEAELKQSGMEMERLRQVESQTAIYRHDMRHHLTMIEGFLNTGKPHLTEEYIKKVQADIEAITPKRYCGNETVNLLCSSFSGKAEHMGIQLTAKVNLPQELSIPDTELCSILSNGLENALYAVSSLEQSLRWVDFYCEVRLNKLLLEIKNPCPNEVVIQDGIPVSARDGHGYGCRSIRTISDHHHGLCTFETENGVFILRVVLPL